MSVLRGSHARHQASRSGRRPMSAVAQRQARPMSEAHAAKPRARSALLYLFTLAQ
jgi:hypothetical protein